MGLRILATLASASCMALVAPEMNLAWLHWFLFLPMFWALRPKAPKSNHWLAFLYGTVAVALIFRWLVDTIVLFSNIPLIGAIGVLLLFSAAFGLPYLAIFAAVHPLRKRFGSGWILALPAWVVIVEWVSDYVLLFPYPHGATQYQSPLIVQWASVTGASGISFLLFWVNCLLAEMMYRFQERRMLPWWHVAACTLTMSGILGFGAWRHQSVEAHLQQAPTFRLGQLQSEHGMLWRMEHSTREAFSEWQDFTRSLEPGSVDLVVWPEGACPYDLNREVAAERMGRLAREGQFSMIVGGGTRERQPDPEMGEDRVVAFNSTYHFDAEGEVQGRYDKIIPLPFGEYMPLSEQFPHLWDWLQGPGSFRAGKVAVVFDTEVGRISTPICYEAILGRVCRRFEQPDVLVNVTNDAWFGDTAATYQHGMLAALRAVELGIPLVRSAYTGTSFIAEPHGHIYAQTGDFESVQRIVEVRKGNVPTLYARFGNWFVIVCVLGLFAMASRPRKRRFR